MGTCSKVGLLKGIAPWELGVVRRQILQQLGRGSMRVVSYGISSDKALLVYQTDKY